MTPPVTSHQHLLYLLVTKFLLVSLSNDKIFDVSMHFHFFFFFFFCTLWIVWNTGEATFCKTDGITFIKIVWNTGGQKRYLVIYCFFFKSGHFLWTLLWRCPLFFFGLCRKSGYLQKSVRKKCPDLTPRPY